MNERVNDVSSLSIDIFVCILDEMCSLMLHVGGCLRCNVAPH
jgi:hypothetical protein